MPLLLLLLPTAAVVMSTIGLLLAAGTPEDLVRDDYYRAGTTINADLTAQALARERRLRAWLDTSHGNVEIRLSDRRAVMQRLLFIHSTRADHDVLVERFADGHANQHVAAGLWRVRADIQLADKRQARLDGVCRVASVCELVAR